ncbi:MAG: PEP-CTERM system histidine kinase PrsK [Burkholderiaceae bacterium]|nr:PEP-CTERM system histidine kinase PrsK [Burkholderiaceae bacterium]
MRPDNLHFSAIGFGLCLLAMVALLVRLRRGPRWGLGAWALAGAAVVCIGWSACGLAFVIGPSPSKWAALRWADLVRAAGWVVFVLVLLREGGSVQAGQRSDGRFALWVGLGVVAAVGLGGLAPPPSLADGAAAGTASKIGLIASLGLAIVGLVCIEQLLRRVPGRQRWSVWPLAIALGGIFAFDLYLYSDAVLLGGLDSVAWSVQSAVTACTVPLLAVAAARNQQWSKPLVVSHGAAFHSTVLLATAVYLLAVAGLGYLVRYFGGAWGPALQIVLFVAATMVMGALLTLGTFRSKVRVLIGKNFFKRRYDYREEWLRFTRLLAAPNESADIYVRCIQALADLVEATAASVWLRREDGCRQVAQWNTPAITSVENANGGLVAFLARTGWVVDLQEYRDKPGRYDHVKLPDWLAATGGAWLLVPLVAAEGLTGFVVLMSPRVRIDVDWEVRDLLKAAGSEVAVLLRQIEVNQALLEAEKFAAISRMSTFVVHDLKNLVAQLSLMLKNAQRHGDNPEFRRDMLETVQHVVDRMNNMLAQARLSTRPVQNPQAVDLATVLRRVCEGKAAQRPGLVCSIHESVFALGHADRLEHVFAHIVQNAIDATTPEGTIRVSAQRGESDVRVDIVDDGVGMSGAFVQQRLFRPFQTTKESGMGIGVYESQQYVSSLGGQLVVESQEGAGTRVCIVLPLAQPEQAKLPTGLEAA